MVILIRNVDLLVSNVMTKVIKEEEKKPTLQVACTRDIKDTASDSLKTFLLSVCLVLSLGLPRLAMIANLSLQWLQLLMLKEPKTTPEHTLFEVFPLEIFVYCTNISFKGSRSKPALG